MPLDPLVVGIELESCQIPLRVNSEIATLEIWVTDESGVSRSIPCEVRRHQGYSVLIMPPFERGYYRLLLRTKAADVAATLIVAPSRCWLPESLHNDMRGWGATTHAYGLRSDDDFGIGDFTLVGKAAEACGKLGASLTISVNRLNRRASSHRVPCSHSSE